MVSNIRTQVLEVHYQDTGPGSTLSGHWSWKYIVVSNQDSGPGSTLWYLIRTLVLEVRWGTVDTSYD